MKYLGKLFGYFPKGDIDQAHADALMSFVTDFVAEGRLVFHARCFTESYYTQKEETQPNIDWFKKDRLTRFLPYLEHVLVFNQKANPNGYFIGESLTYVDIAVWHTIEATASQFPETY